VRIAAYVHFHTRDVRIVTNNRKTLIWHIPKQKFWDIFRVPPSKKSVREAMQLCVRRGMLDNIPIEQRNKFHQTWVWSRGGWSRYGVYDTSKEKRP
jgi:hypothetical protein